MNVLITEVADSCELSDSSFEERGKISNRAFFLSESGDYGQAIECYLSILPYDELKFPIYKELSISYSKVGKCEDAQVFANKYIEWAKSDWAAWADQVAANKGVFERDWTDFSDRIDIETPYEEVEDPQKDEILAALAECKSDHESDGT